jgi:hypothetical protein
MSAARQMAGLLTLEKKCLIAINESTLAVKQLSDLLDPIS